MVTVSKNYS